LKKVFASIYLFFSFILADTGSFEKGVAFYDARSKGAVGYNVKPLHIENAIKQFKKAYSELELDAGVYLMKSYYFKGKFIAKTNDEKKKVFSKGKNLGERLINSYPNSAAVRYWFLVNLGSWAEVYGAIAAAKEGVAGMMRDHAKKIIEIDPNYSNGGGYFMLGAVHFKSPYIPFILSWPDNNLAIKNLEKAYSIGNSTPSQTVYLAQALYKNGDVDTAKSHLYNILKQSLSLNQKVEDFDQHQIAKSLLEEWK
tara:strand:- start:44 stop:805 length:762 start_codon:yes stop_codon:yes gene_type:complete